MSIASYLGQLDDGQLLGRVVRLLAVPAHVPICICKKVYYIYIKVYYIYDIPLYL